MDKFECIKVFVRVAQLGSFTLVANEMSVSQGSISKKVAWLESRIGFLLLHRNSRNISLTPQGKEYLSYCERLIDDMSAFEARLNGEKNQVTGELKLSVPSAMATLKLAQPISEFMSLHPDLVINVSVNDKLVDLIQSDIDIAVRASVLEDSGYRARFLFNNQGIYIASADYLRRYGEPKTAQDLTQHNCLTYTLSHPSNIWHLVSKAGEVEKVSVAEGFKSDSPELLLKMALHGKGITLLPSWMAEPYIKDGSLVQVFKSHAPLTLPMYALFKVDEYQPHRIRAFIEYLVEFFKNEQD